MVALLLFKILKIKLNYESAAQRLIAADNVPILSTSPNFPYFTAEVALIKLSRSQSFIICSFPY
jgi:hypothetical protein